MEVGTIGAQKRRAIGIGGKGEMSVMGGPTHLDAQAAGQLWDAYEAANVVLQPQAPLVLEVWRGRGLGSWCVVCVLGLVVFWGCLRGVARGCVVVSKFV